MSEFATDAVLAGIAVPARRRARVRRTPGAGYAVVNAAVAVAALVVLAPVLLAAAVAVAASGGPVLARRTQAGRDGRAFVLHTFRTPVTDTGHPTRVGAMLRRSGADGLPQLFHVVTGTMAIVGPRPRSLAEAGGTGQWSGPVAKPGLTGLWQATGRRRLSREECARLDAVYTDAWSPALDVAILRRTAGTVLRGTGGH